ncbi:MAG TPA: hypothetical protein VFZ59_16760 [Verrucomicrobiae bacterium]|nr:hypothetical protein [Verrucomicrobiae bacterium]
MKIKFSPKQLRVATSVGLFASAIVLMASGSDRKPDYIAHEWGTFTSVQGADGVLLNWRPLETSHLPSFVYDWNKPGLNRSLMTLTKGVMTSLQRMETPVIYFYAKHAQTVDVSVQFPQGNITEWFPQADQIGPAWKRVSGFVTKLDAGMQKVGVNPEYSFASLLQQHVAKDSRIVWNDVQILPADQHSKVASLIPSDKSGSHYFAARDTDAAYVRINSLSPTNPAPEYDKFLFYRGLGSFPTPLRVTMASDNRLSLTNTGSEILADLFVIRLRKGSGQFIHLGKLGPSAEQTVEFGQDVSQDSLLPELEKKMVAALTQQGLYAREATAMVNTWKDSWFAEDGTRVLYVLPREWTDRTLPIELSPQPKELARVMVGRAELIPPSVQDTLCQSLKRATDGDAAAREQATSELKHLGRFAEAALGLVRDTEANKTGWSVLQAMNKAKAEQARLQNAVVKSN